MNISFLLTEIRLWFEQILHQLQLDNLHLSVADDNPSPSSKITTNIRSSTSIRDFRLRNVPHLVCYEQRTRRNMQSQYTDNK